MPKNGKLEFKHKFRYYESTLASMYAKLVSLEKGLVKLNEKWQIEDEKSHRSSVHKKAH